MNWWLQPLPESSTATATKAAGLSSALAAERLKQVGANRFREHAERPLLLQYLARFRNPLVLILLAYVISAEAVKGWFYRNHMG